jgi:outer membrane protein OmpA-like peptidoglycan-associated protein
VLNGTVTQNILRATGVDQSDGVKSQFVLLVGEDGAMRGLRSSNGAPFAEYSGATAAEGLVKCPAPPPPTLGCGAIIHGITFGFDSAEILPASESVLAMLHRGLRDDPSASIVIEGHTSSEGTDAYNQGLSERRARAVVADLTSRGIAAGRLTAVGIGEKRPIATNNDETGRAMNRRVEVVCR